MIPSINFVNVNQVTAKLPDIEKGKLNIVAEPKEDLYKKSDNKPEIEKIPIKKEIIKPILKTDRRRPSALSLNTIHKKKERKDSSEEKEINTDNLPTDPFTEDQFVALWNAYVKNLNKKGEKIIASIMNADVPKVDGFTIELIFPNSMMKAELLKIRPKLLKHFREELNNYSIDFEIKVNEEREKKFAYTAQEKYNKLLEKNKALAKLKNTFKLDL